MTKKEAIKILLAELLNRIPKSNKVGVIPHERVYEAIELLQENK